MKFVKWLGKLSAHLLEGTITIIMSFLALASLYIFDSLALKLCGFFGAFIIGYGAAYFLGKVRGEHKE
ncbi:hypothetical protein KYI92_09385 [Pantoea allii]|uniref:Phage protein n=1 Tax=Pantoea allii TaxID=574096 RepID=A0ABS6VCA5_9GAMM|nr:MULTISPECIES: hypothetical protein [Pantoea]MBW1213815.1 hypothetical protein [Pantoea allii]MBW1256942.1 hypothetical protein [Pantoea allii]MBW1266019.1 hypothetical protein [Pantoea allii]MBW1288602.1 hypothetical protein [Pantoea allii]OAE08112.1 hypothetical protein A6A26_11025 [Pantoea sp. OXWO6B1]